jgi:hypothetical protein
MSGRQQKIDLFANRKIDREKLYRETPIQLEKSFKYIDIPKQPSGFTPMSEIELEGVIYRNLASGKAPLWMTITCCFLYGCFIFTALGFILSVSVSGTILTVTRLIAVLLFTIPVFISCWRGMRAKISHEKSNFPQNRGH